MIQDDEGRPTDAPRHREPDAPRVAPLPVRSTVLELVRGGATAVTKAVEAFAAGDIEYARDLVGIADEHLASALELLERRAAA